jgi:hypothetical protein
MRAAGDVYIAGSLTADNWKETRKTLAGSNDAGCWRKALHDYFDTRLRLRYLDPIRILQENGTFQGEGFSIAAIQCTLIEFLESTVQGRNYRYRHNGDPPLGPYEYSNSSDLFVQFLTTRTPFDAEFDPALARKFYENVRCGLLHEARTKGGWTIWAKGFTGKIVLRDEKIIYRDDFHSALLRFIDWYKDALINDASLQEAFIRKFDSLCV